MNCPRIPPGPRPSRKDTTASSSSTVDFFGSQIGDQTVINYSYTDQPLKLLAWDVYYFFHYLWALPYVLLPYRPHDSGDLSELAPTRQNLFCIFVHFVLLILQLGFLLCFPPVALFLPLWMTAVIVGAFMALNKCLCMLLNGRDMVYYSDAKYAKPGQDRFAHEQWVFLNGVAAGEHWLKSNLNRLALTFGRPVTGIHNRTNGIIFDVIECLIQRNLAYATNDVRICYRIVKEKLYSPQYSKVVFILHSQGGIEGGLVLDWLLQELPQNLLCKLEVYSFGNAANHWNNPYRSVGSQAKAEDKPLAASVDAVGAVGLEPSSGHSPDRQETQRGNGHAERAVGFLRNRGQRPPTPTSPPPLKTNTSSLLRGNATDNATGESPTHTIARVETPSSNPPTQSGRAIGHVEHYAHTTDFVALWGVLHFATSATANRTMPRFIGRLFSRASPDGRGGHQFVQHYLDGMFPLERDPVTGQLIGCKEVGNEFMESEIVIGRPGDEGACEREAFASSYLGCLEDEMEAEELRRRIAGGGVLLHNGESPIELRRRLGLPVGNIKVKELSRLWKYRNGKSPLEKPSLLERGLDGFVRNATM